MNAMMVLPFDGSIQFPGVPPEDRPGFCLLSYAPPPDYPYVLAEISTTQANITTLTNDVNCLFLCNVLEDGTYDPAPLSPTDRVNIVNKIRDMDLPLGLLNAAIQASQNQAELVEVLAKKAMPADEFGNLMEDEHLLGAGLG